MGIEHDMSLKESVPITLLGKDYELQFDPLDVDACETEMMIGYVHFFRTEGNTPVYLSLRLCRSFLHHGLRTIDKRGNSEYVFPQTQSGAAEAAFMIKQAMQQDSRTLITIWEKSRDAYSTGWFAPAGTEKKEKDPGEAESKNLPGTGSST